MNTSSLNVEISGQRAYVRGNTWPIKDRLRGLGAHWDSQAKAWWVGTIKAELLRDLVAKANSEAQANTGGRPEKETCDSSTRVKARVEYKGRKYYLVAEGESRAKLTTLDGSLTFWADRGRMTVIKQYGRYNDRGGFFEYPTLGSMQDFIEDRKKGIPTRAEIMAEIEHLDDLDEFEAARNLARQHGIPY